MDICLVKVGEVDEQTIEIIERNFPRYFNWNIKEILKLPIPIQSFNPKRKQFHSSTIISFISNSLSEKPCQLVLSVTEVDLYVEGLNFVFGEARPDLGICIISTHRLKPEYYGERKDLKIFERRVLTEAVHEIGHLLNLKHCKNPNCVMFFSNSIFDTDRKGFLFCDRCKIKITEIK
jgi:archaemetzincin